MKKHNYRLFLNSIPKSGSHLMTKLMELLDEFEEHRKNIKKYVRQQKKKVKYSPETVRVRDIPLPILEKYFSLCEEGKYHFTHIRYHQALYEIFKRLNYKMIIIIRDPRDVTASLANYSLKTKSYRLHRFFKNLKNFDEVLKYTITGVTPEEFQKKLKLYVFIQKIKNKLGLRCLPYRNLMEASVRNRFDNFIQWTKKPDFLTVKFEDLVGEKGGGSRERQEQAIRAIFKYLQIPEDGERINYLCENIFSPKSKTFHKGQIGGFKDIYKPEHKELFKKVAGDLLIQLGYEKDNNW
ncbi:MAG: sulfotransferase domain-containing protein [bacterium]|nr:sulfotransferase domain-containing protein [bacterium]